MRRGDFDLAFEEFSVAIKLNAPQNRYTNLYNRGRVQTLRKQYDSGAGRLRRSAAAQSGGAAGFGVPLHRLHRDGQIRRSARRLQRGAHAIPEGDIHPDKPRQRLSGEGRSRQGAGRLQPGHPDQPELCSRLCGPRPALREAPRSRRGALRLPRRQRRACQGRRHRNHAGAPLCQGAARGAAGRVDKPRGKRRRRRRVRARWR